MSEEFVLKACKLFRRHVDTIIEKIMLSILSKIIIFSLSSYFDVYFFKLELIFFSESSRLLLYLNILYLAFETCTFVVIIIIIII